MAEEMFNFSKPGLLPPFSPAATQAAVEASTVSYPADYITNIIIEISGYLVSLVEQSTLLGRHEEYPYSPSLHTLNNRLHSGHLNPSPIQSHANESVRIKANIGQRTTKDAAHRPLEDFEDLYYAVLACMQNIYHILNARLGSGFSALTDLVCPDGPSIADLYVSLAQYWDTLNHTAFVKAIDCAVRRSRVKYLHQEILAQVRHDEITQTDADELLSDLYDPNEFDGIQGLAWVSGWAPSMVAAWLEEKYRVVLQIEKEDAESKSRMQRKRAKMGVKGRQPQYEREIRQEGKRVVDEMEYRAQVDLTAIPTEQQKQQHTTTGQRDAQDELQYALEWHIKTQRVSEYSQYLRSMASRDAKYLVQSTASNNNIRVSNFGGPVQDIDNGDTNMMGNEF